jgi:hypothetical protein
MQRIEFERSLAGKEPPAGIPPALQALWWMTRGNWDAAHEIVMRNEDTDCAWVHAHLHRAEGDLPNARYWYRRAGKPEASIPLAQERDAMMAALVGD